MKKRKSKNFKGDVSKKHGKPMDPQDHVAHNLQGLPTDKYGGEQLGTSPSPAPTPQTMLGPSMYPGQELGA